jgi:3'-phosphoadenosine 5'-phosphosulfate (PAPS) 3'-phosphatase
MGVEKHVIKGSVGLKATLIAERNADFYISGSRKIKMWDTCAPAAIFWAAGGIITALEGESLEFSGPVAHGHGICMVTPSCEPWLRPRLDDAIKRFVEKNPDLQRT